MTTEAVINIATETIWTIIEVSAPLLLLSLVVGLIISIFQTVTSIQEQTLTFIPKILVIFLGMLIFGSFMLDTIVSFMQELWSNFGAYL